MTDNQRIAIVGAGAIGCVTGALLKRAGEQVTLIGKPEQVRAINSRGLHIRGPGGDLQVDIEAAEKLEFEPSLVLLSVKSQDVREACLEIREKTGRSPVVAMQNGLRGDEEAASVLGEDRVIGCVVFFSASYLEAGKISYTKEGALVIGSPYNRHEKAEEAAQTLSKAMKTLVTKDIRDARYTKLLLNVMGNSVDAMTGRPLAECAKDPRMRKLAALILKEALQVIEKAGGRPASLPGMPAPLLRGAIKLPLPISALLLKPVLKSETQESSTLQSIKRGRPVETEYINGEIVRLARENGMEAPVNARVLEVISEVSEWRDFLSAEQLAERFSEFL